MARQACRRQVRGSQTSGHRSLKQKTEVDFRVFHKQRRCGSMKRMLFLGALVLGVTVCSQSFGFELLDRMLGHKGCASCCEPGCDAGAGCCEPGCDAGNGCCEPACGAGGGCAEPACGAGNGCAEPACDAGNGCCEPSCGAASCCGTRKKCTPIADLLRAIREAKKRHHRSCCDSCCGEPDCSAGCAAEPACGAGNGCCEPACGAAVAPVATPAAPTPDASAAKKSTGKVVAVSRTVATK
jgi:hypothetical protein